MARLLVSVRSRAEALDALSGGASVIDVKEPSKGPLGRADDLVVREIREIVPERIPLSAALGELAEFTSKPPPEIGFAKLGLARAPAAWRAIFQSRRREAPRLKWVAVIYADWREADAPRPEEVLEVARGDEAIAAVLVDTWNKSRSNFEEIDLERIVGSARAARLLSVLAGGLGLEAIARLAPLRPDYFGVRSAACRGGDRSGVIDPSRVRELAAAVAEIPTSETHREIMP